LEEPPSIDANEITDKGYINQRAVLMRRAALVERLHAREPDPEVIVAPQMQEERQLLRA
jgi:feruloyl-CoA synthase